MTSENLEKAGKAAYEAFIAANGASRGNATGTGTVEPSCVWRKQPGDKIPELPEYIRGWWRAAAEAAIKSTR